MVEVPEVSAAAVHAQLEKVLASATFRGANRSGRLLRFLVAETLSGRAAYLKEYSLGAEALGRGPTFDPRADPIARVEASRLRSRLELYYATEGAADDVVITLARGGYVPTFEVGPAGARVSEGETQPPAATTWWRAPLWFTVGAAVVAGGFVIASWQRPRDRLAASEPLIQLDVDLGASGVLASAVGNDLALSPDGTVLVFVSLLADGSTRLYARRLDRLQAYELPGTVGARSPFFSPDSRWVGFWAEGKLKKTLIEGRGSPVTLADATDLLGASWGEHGDIVATLNSTPTLWRVADAGGTPTPLIEISDQSISPRWPQLLPGGRAVLFTAMLGQSIQSIDVVSLHDGSRKTLVRGGTYGRYLESGHLVYVDRGTLFAVPFDVDHLEIRGTPAPVLNTVAYSPGFGFAQFDVARDGTLVYERTGGSGLTTIAWLHASDEPTTLLNEPAQYQWPRLSPDGRQLAFSLLEGSDFDIWTYDIASRTKTRLTATEADEAVPAWTPDGEFILYQSRAGMFWQRADGAGEPELLLPGVRVPWSFTADSRRLAYHEMSAETGFDLWTVPIEAGPDGLRAGRPELFRSTAVFETYPTFSPDGRWIAYGSNESGVWDVYVRAFPDDDHQVRVSSHGGRIPAWSKGTSELFYETNDHRLMVASYSVQDGVFNAEPARVWSTTQLADTGVLANFDLAPDGKSVVALLSHGAAEQQPARDHVTLLLNFFDELRRVHAAARVDAD